MEKEGWNDFSRSESIGSMCKQFAKNQDLVVIEDNKEVKETLATEIETSPYISMDQTINVEDLVTNTRVD